MERKAGALTFCEAQARVDAWISQFEEGYFEPLVQISRMVEELGELARSVSHEMGKKRPKAGELCHGVDEEVGDLLFVLICFANARGLDLGSQLETTLRKIDGRDRARWTLKASLGASGEGNEG